MKKIVPIEYVRGDQAYRSIIADSVEDEELQDDVFYLCTDSPDVDDDVCADILARLSTEDVKVFNPESNLVETKKMVIDGDFAYEVEEE